MIFLVMAQKQISMVGNFCLNSQVQPSLKPRLFMLMILLVVVQKANRGVVEGLDWQVHPMDHIANALSVRCTCACR